MLLNKGETIVSLILQASKLILNKGKNILKVNLEVVGAGFEPGILAPEQILLAAPV